MLLVLPSSSYLNLLYNGVGFTYRDDSGGQVFKQLGLYDPSGKFEEVSDRAYKMESGTVYIWWRR